MSEELKPCPFCNSTAEIIKETSRRFKSGDPHYVRCIECNTSSSYYVSKEKAIEKWNTRA